MTKKKTVKLKKSVEAEMNGVLCSPVTEELPKEKPLKPKKKSKKELKTEAGFERLEMPVSNAPDSSLVFIDKECWRVLPKSKVNGIVKLWRLKLAGGDEVIEIPLTQTIKIQRMYLEDNE